MYSATVDGYLRTSIARAVARRRARNEAHLQYFTHPLYGRLIQDLEDELEYDWLKQMEDCSSNAFWRDKAIVLAGRGRDQLAKLEFPQ